MAISIDLVIVGTRGDFDEVAVALKRSGHHKLLSPRAQRHILLEDVVVAIALAVGYAGDGVAVEDGDGLENGIHPLSIISDSVCLIFSSSSYVVPFFPSLIVFSTTRFTILCKSFSVSLIVLLIIVSVFFL
jgi:hypothetical protein